jgi:hypothetical protein
VGNWDDISATLGELDGDSSNIIDLIQRSYDVSEIVLALVCCIDLHANFVMGLIITRDLYLHTVRASRLLHAVRKQFQ